MIRAFVALDLDSAALSALGLVLGALRGSAPARVHARWSAPEQMHVTLKFLGSTTEEQAGSLGDALGSIAGAGLPPVSLGALGAFPDPGRASVLMMKVDDPSGAVAEIRRATEDRAASLGFARETRAFVPHVTLARLREPRNVIEWLRRVPLEPLEATLTALALYRSDPAPGGSRYTALASAPIGLRPR